MRLLLLPLALTLITTNVLDAENRHIWNNKEEINNLISQHDKAQNPDSVIYYLDELIMFYGDDKSFINTLGRKIGYLTTYNRTAEALQLALSTYYQYCNPSENPENCNVCGNTYTHLSKLMITLQDYRQSLGYVNRICENNRNGFFYYQKAILYNLLEIPDSALIISNQGIEKAKRTQDTKNIINAYNNYGLIARQLNQYGKAIFAFSKALNIIDSIQKDSTNYSFIVGNLGTCYYEIEEYDKAYECFRIDSKGSEMYTNKTSYILAEIGLSKIEEIKKEHHKVIKRLKSLNDNYHDHLTPTCQLTVLKKLMNAYKSIGNQAEYDNYAKLWNSLNQTHFENQINSYKALIKEYTSNTLKQVTKNLELEKRLLDQKLLVQQKENQQKQFKSWLIIGLLLVAIIIGLLIFLRFKAVQAKKASLKDANLKLALQEQEILTLKFKEESKNVQSLALELLIKKDFSHKLLKELDQLKNVSNAELQNIKLFIQNELDVKSGRAHLQNKMGNLSSNFYTELKINHPNLTKKDLKMAALVALQLPNKEIAISKNITLASAKKSKNRLKKKLNIPANTDLTSYLQKFYKPL